MKTYEASELITFIEDKGNAVHGEDKQRFFAVADKLMQILPPPVGNAPTEPGCEQFDKSDLSKSIVNQTDVCQLIDGWRSKITNAWTDWDEHTHKAAHSVLEFLYQAKGEAYCAPLRKSPPINAKGSVNILKHPLIKQAYELCLHIEGLPASELQTAISVQASELTGSISQFFESCRGIYFHRGALLIADERARQIEEEHFTSDHDDQHVNRELANAALAYLDLYVAREHVFSNEMRLPGIEDGPKAYQSEEPRDSWPWRDEDWNPQNPMRDLIKAGALIAAEIDRLLRKEDKARQEKPVRFKEYRKDGWPLCPKCGEDELVSQLINAWTGSEGQPTLDECLRNDFACANCDWRG